MLSEVTAHQLHLVTRPHAFDITTRLHEPTIASKKLAKFLLKELELSDIDPAYILTSSCACLGTTEKCSKGDIALLKAATPACYTVGELWFFASLHGECVALVSLWTLESYDASSAVWRKVVNPSLIDLSLVLAPVIWTDLPGDRVRTLTPPLFRGLSAV